MYMLCKIIQVQDYLFLQNNFLPSCDITMLAFKEESYLAEDLLGVGQLHMGNGACGW